MPSSTSRPGTSPGRCRNSLRPCAASCAPASRPSSNGCRTRAAIRCSAVRVEVDRCSSPSARRDRTCGCARKRASSAAFSSAQRTARSGIGRFAGSTISTSSSPRAYSEIASSLRPVGSVSMSNDSTRGSISTRAGCSVGLSKSQAMRSPRHRVAGDLAAAFDAALDQVARREPNVGLERVDARRVQPIAQRRHVGRRRDFDARDGRAVERLAVGRLGRWRAERAPRARRRPNGCRSRAGGDRRAHETCCRPRAGHTGSTTGTRPSSGPVTR